MIYNTEHSPQSKAKLPKLGHVLSQKKLGLCLVTGKSTMQKKKNPVTSNLRYIYEVLNVDEIKN
jgi:hypothetical protein